MKWPGADGTDSESGRPEAVLEEIVHACLERQAPSAGVDTAELRANIDKRLRNESPQFLSWAQESRDRLDSAQAEASSRASRTEFVGWAVAGRWPYTSRWPSAFREAELGWTPRSSGASWWPPLGEFSYDPATAEQQFAGDATTICTSQKDKHAATPLTVLYAGREATLPTLVGQFQQASICAGLTITIVTGSDSNALPASVTDESDLPGANVIVVYSDIASIACLNQEYDPWEVATYNSVMAAAATVSQAASAGGSRTASPTGPLTAATVLSKALDMVGSAPYQAPNGSFGFDPNGELLKPVIPVYTDANSTCS